jgi:hemerythrin-like domain-containing protein
MEINVPPAARRTIRARTFGEEEWLMPSIITLLKRDHADFLKTLETLEDQARIASEGGKPNHDFIRRVISFFKDYPRRLHYRREEILLKMIDRYAPHAAANVMVSLRYHRTLSDRLDDLEQCFLYFEQDEDAGRVGFVTAAIRFAEFEKAHFSDEDRYLLPLARQVLSTQELHEDSTDFPWNALEEDESLPPVPAPPTVPPPYAAP